MFTDDPIADFNRHSREQEEWLDSRPVCSECGHHIQDEYCYEINDEYICEDCLKYYHRKRTEDVI